MFRIEGVRSDFHALRQFVWWRDDTVLAVAVEESTGDCRSNALVGESRCGSESIIQFSLVVDRENKCIKLQKWLVEGIMLSQQLTI